VLPDKEIIRCEFLLVGFQRGEPSAMAELVLMFERPLVYYLRRLVGSEADAWDLLQETWLQVYRHMGSIRDRRAFPAYLYRTARNAALMYLRKRRADAALLAAVDPPVEEEGADIALRAEDAEVVHRGLDSLSPPHREVLTLFFLQDLSLDDIATVLEVPLGTVKSRLHYAKRALREKLE
jgi:RNA polymerase sigma-70 factor (ECF subfamily)